MEVLRSNMIFTFEFSVRGKARPTAFAQEGQENQSAHFAAISATLWRMFLSCCYILNDLKRGKRRCIFIDVPERQELFPAESQRFADTLRERSIR